MPKVSVIVPVYNVEKYLDRCLDSLVNQTLQEIEIIVVNDSTPDQSQTIIDKYIRLYPNKVFGYIKPNGGLSDARNYGMQFIKGEYFGFVDGDDYTHPNMLKALYDEAIKVDADIVTSNFYWDYMNGTLKKSVDGPYCNAKDLLVNMYVMVWNKLYKKSFYDNLDIQFPKSLRYEDVSFSIKLAASVNTIAYVNEESVYYIQRENSIMSTQNERVADMQKIFLDIFDYYEKKDLFTLYYTELEYLTARFFLGSTFVQTCQIPNKQIRNQILNENWKLLNSKFPNWKKNKYLKEKKDLKHLLYKNHNKISYIVFSKLYYLYKNLNKTLSNCRLK